MEQQLAELRAERSAEVRAQMRSAQIRTAELQKDWGGVEAGFPLSLSIYMSMYMSCICVCICIYIYNTVGGGGSTIGRQSGSLSLRKKQWFTVVKWIFLM